ncbi:unnamed protein product [Chrysodeixis includens]|uniref:Uncharacterized protein n=1 Tax=Chrysodeixis includens TaxID=689277 RepID=A0A9P0FUL4_CHRIL|nr:unnamed protein product [Chrysodeixis includens]
MSKTPTKSDPTHVFIAREITTPNKDQQGVSKAVFSHVSKLHGLLNDWMKLRDRGVNILNNQLRALAKLQPTDDPVIFTWSVTKISDTVQKIYDSLVKEDRLKQVITENVAHCRDEKLVEIYTSAWEFEAYFNMESNAYLFVEVGLAGVT